jgi:hypothetical protein
MANGIKMQLQSVSHFYSYSNLSFVFIQEESGFNPNLFWYKELLSTRKRAGEYRSNAEADHFNRDHTLQLKTGQGGTKNFHAWDANDDDDVDSVVSIDR